MADSKIPILRPGTPFDGKQPVLEQPDPVTAKLYEAVLPSTVQIATERSLGSGFAIDNMGHIATDAHVALSGTRLRVATSDGRVYPAKISRLDGTKDIAILEVPELANGGISPVHLQNSHLSHGKKVWAVGHPLGSVETYISPGSRSDYVPMSTLGSPKAIDDLLQSSGGDSKRALQAAFGRSVISANAHIEHGSSGGPLFDEKARAIGMAELMSPDGSRSGFTPAEDILALQNKPSQYEFKYTHQPSAEGRQLESLFATRGGAVGTAVAAGALAYGARIAFEFLPRTVGVIGGITAGLDAIDDIPDFLSATTTRDKTKTGLYALADVGAIAGAALTFFPATRALGGKMLATSLLGKLGAELIPTVLTLQEIDAAQPENLTFPCVMGSQVACDNLDRMTFAKK